MLAAENARTELLLCVNSTSQWNSFHQCVRYEINRFSGQWENGKEYTITFLSQEIAILE